MSRPQAPWIAYFVTTPTDPKIGRLALLLCVRRAEACGLLANLWAHAMLHSRSGSLSGLTSSCVAQWADWEFNAECCNRLACPDEFVLYLIESGWIKGSVPGDVPFEPRRDINGTPMMCPDLSHAYLSGWDECNGGFMAARDKERDKKRRMRAKETPTGANSVPGTSPPTVPDLTIPNSKEKEQESSPPAPRRPAPDPGRVLHSKAATRSPKSGSQAAPTTVCKAFQTHAYDSWSARYGTKPPWGAGHYANLAKAFHEGGDDASRVVSAWDRYLLDPSAFFKGHDPKKFASNLGQFVGVGAPVNGQRRCSDCNNPELADFPLDRRLRCPACVDLRASQRARGGA
jgi:hypothetical protein